MKAVGYVRVSTREQADSGLSLANQANKIKQFCQLKDLRLLEIITDAGHSAKDLNRPGIQKVIEGAETKRFGMVVVYKLDRLTRKVRDLGQLAEDIFEQNGIEFASIQESYDTSTANGKLVMNIIATVAQWERDIISERTKDVLQGKADRGERLGTPPFGFKLDVDSRQLIENLVERTVIDRVIELRNNGQTLKQISETLNRENYLTRQGNPWKHQNISYLLRSTA